MDKAKTTTVGGLKDMVLKYGGGVKAGKNYLNQMNQVPKYQLEWGPQELPKGWENVAKPVDPVLKLQMEQAKAEARLKELELELTLLTRKKLPDEEAIEVASIVEKLEGLGAFLGGSREKLKDRDFSSVRDWDFHVQHFNQAYDQNFIPIHDEPADFKYVLNNFKHVHNEEAESYKDKFFGSYWKHKKYEHITVILNLELALYIKVWTKLSKKYWKNHIWKSNPVRAKELSDPDNLRRHKQKTRDLFNMLHDMVELDYEDCM